MAGRPLSLPEKPSLSTGREWSHARKVRCKSRIKLFPLLFLSCRMRCQTSAHELGCRQQRRKSTCPGDSKDDEAIRRRQGCCAKLRTAEISEGPPNCAEKGARQIASTQPCQASIQGCCLIHPKHDHPKGAERSRHQKGHWGENSGGHQARIDHESHDGSDKSNCQLLPPVCGKGQVDEQDQWDDNHAEPRHAVARAQHGRKPSDLKCGEVQDGTHNLSHGEVI